jgi:hypothetical protein
MKRTSFVLAEGVSCVPGEPYIATFVDRVGKRAELSVLCVCINYMTSTRSIRSGEKDFALQRNCFESQQATGMHRRSMWWTSMRREVSLCREGLPWPHLFRRDNRSAVVLPLLINNFLGDMDKGKWQRNVLKLTVPGRKNNIALPFRPP